jgi:PilZ domain-containing protein
MVETRRAPRHRVSKAGTIEFGGGHINCMVRNLSTTGAALEISCQVGIPEKFALVVPGDGLHLQCDVVWRKSYRIGVTFS